MQTEAATRTSAAPAGFWPAFAALIAGAVAMGASPIMVRLADVGPFASAFFRVFLALPFLYAWMRLEDARRGGGVSGTMFTPIIFATGVAFAADLFFWHLAIVNTSVANATFFATTAPVWVGLFGWLVLGRRIGAATLFGLGLCILGGAALVWESMALSPGHLAGDIYAAITAIFFGIYFLTVESARTRYGAAAITFHMSVVTAAFLAISAVVATVVYGQRLFPADLTGWAVLVALAVISHAGGQGLLSIALGSLPSMFSSLVIFLEAVAAALLGWLVLGEAVSAIQALGGLAILVGIWLARPRAAKVQPAQT